jgi:hypothetical protein
MKCHVKPAMFYFFPAIFSLVLSSEIASAQKKTYKFDPDQVNSVFDAICGNDLDTYKLGEQVLSEQLPGDSIQRIRLFQSMYVYDLVCPRRTIMNGTGACVCDNYNFLQFSIYCETDPITNYIVQNTGYDLERNIGNSGKNIIDWITDVAANGFLGKGFVSENQRTYLAAVKAYLIKWRDKKKNK